ncbi:hypothetical protein EVAR_5967_1 [Eumeta japonica]|uniref:Uncharacterized protein n=1 Tax=Eumeta variegata TaxID=151549 RepID=A0A4C1TC99_EUMVA|nr:hypothetical protein EVAR_5967_1 [Eumeta japonica]
MIKVVAKRRGVFETAIGRISGAGKRARGVRRGGEQLLEIFVIPRLSTRLTTARMDLHFTCALGRYLTLAGPHFNLHLIISAKANFRCLHGSVHVRRGRRGVDCHRAARGGGACATSARIRASAPLNLAT